MPEIPQDRVVGLIYDRILKRFVLIWEPKKAGRARDKRVYWRCTDGSIITDDFDALHHPRDTQHAAMNAALRIARERTGITAVVDPRPLIVGRSGENGDTHRVFAFLCYGDARTRTARGRRGEIVQQFSPLQLNLIFEKGYFLRRHNRILLAGLDRLGII